MFSDVISTMKTPAKRQQDKQAKGKPEITASVYKIESNLLTNAL